jgi:hypothetical protein
MYMDLRRLINRVNLQEISRINLVKEIRAESLKDANHHNHFGLMQAKCVMEAINEAYRLGVIRGQTINHPK